MPRDLFPEPGLRSVRTSSGKYVGIEGKHCSSCMFLNDCALECHRYPPPHQPIKSPAYEWCGEWRARP